MKTIKFIYNSLEDLKIFQKLNLDKYNVETYSEKIYKERRKAHMIKSSCSASQLPFIAIYHEDGTIFKAFYQESGNSLEHLQRYITGKKKIAPKLFIDFILQCKNLNLSIKDIISNIQYYYDTDKKIKTKCTDNQQK